MCRDRSKQGNGVTVESFFSSGEIVGFAWPRWFLIRPIASLLFNQRHMLLLLLRQSYFGRKVRSYIHFHIFSAVVSEEGAIPKPILTRMAYVGARTTAAYYRNTIPTDHEGGNWYSNLIVLP